MNFSDLRLNEALLAALATEGYSAPTSIQQQAIPEVMAGRDLVGLAQTGTGKTAAFALPILHQLLLNPTRGRRHVRVLVLAPTRELAAQIGESFAAYGRGTGIRQTVIFGGVGQDKQVRALRDGQDILVATPGRLLDLHGQGLCDLRHVEIFVLDEADRMLDMGFVHDVKKVVKMVAQRRQTLLFSATMPSEVKELVAGLLKDPARVEVHPVSSTAERIEQSVYLVEKKEKRQLLEHLLEDRSIRRALVFTRTKHGANRVAESLEKAGIQAAAIHGNKSQGARERALRNFTVGDIRVLVATDIAARGIDIDDISHVINFDLPNVPESYVHRIGRTGRAQASGTAFSFCDVEERAYLADIEKVIGKPVPRVESHPFRSPVPAGERPVTTPAPASAGPRRSSRPSRPQSGPGRSATSAPAAATGARGAGSGAPASQGARRRRRRPPRGGPPRQST